jgi:hypothetical protein
MATINPSTRRASPEGLFSFPNPVNEISARFVAGGVVLMTALTLIFDLRWMTAVLAYGFVARVLTGPTLSPLGLLVTKFVTPRLSIEPRYVAGPPKRFAQGIGAVLTLTAMVMALVFDLWGVAQLLLGALLVAASLEAFVGFCLGCKIFALLMRMGIIPDAVCADCNDIWRTAR